MSSRKLTRSIATDIAAIAVAAGAFAILAYLIVSPSFGYGALDTANATTLAQTGQNERVVGQIPPNWRPGTGTIITGAAANKARASRSPSTRVAPSTVC
jgi:hypothetical protein